jgi:hypothetical protein
MDKLLATVAPGGKYDPAKVGDYVDAFKKMTVTDPDATFTVKAEFYGEKVKLTGEVFDRTHHDRLIDMLVALKLYSLTNYLRLPNSGKRSNQIASFFVATRH